MSDLNHIEFNYAPATNVRFQFLIAKKKSVRFSSTLMACTAAQSPHISLTTCDDENKIVLRKIKKRWKSRNHRSITAVATWLCARFSSNYSAQEMSSSSKIKPIEKIVFLLFCEISHLRLPLTIISGWRKSQLSDSLAATSHLKALRKVQPGTRSWGRWGGRSDKVEKN